uniref:Putative tail protein n=2 Tax=viral metagenome TaxID=1070528 RepID=A0A6M3IWH9_9ZZZZ
MAVSASAEIEMQLSGSAGDWTAVTSDARRQGPITAKYGILSSEPMRFVGDVGTLNFELDNSEGNSAKMLGYYAPDHACCLTGFDIGTPTRLSITYSGSTFYKFTGRLDSVEPVPGRYRDRRTVCQALDWFGDADAFKLRLLEVQVNKRADEALDAIVSSMTKRPSASSLSAGQETFAYCLDNSRDETTTVLRELKKLMDSELGYCYVVGDQSTGGLLKFDSRHVRPMNHTLTACLTDTDLVDAQVSRRTSNLFNQVRLVAHPREVDDSASVLFTLQSTPQMAPSTSMVITGRYSDPGQRGLSRVGGASMIAPCPATDYTMNSAEDGGGTDLTTNFTVAASYGGNSVQYEVANLGAVPGYITLLQARGRGLYDREPVAAEQVSESSVDLYGERVLTFDMPYNDDPLVAADFAGYLIGVLPTPSTRLEQVEFIGNVSDELMTAGLVVEPGARVKLTEAVTGIASEFFVQGCEVVLAVDGTIHFKWYVAPASSALYWILGIEGASELDETTILGY